MLGGLDHDPASRRRILAAGKAARPFAKHFFATACRAGSGERVANHGSGKGKGVAKRPREWAAMSYPTARSGWLSPEDYGDHHNSTPQLITGSLNGS
jgi:hypothetical protein